MTTGRGREREAASAEYRTQGEDPGGGRGPGGTPRGRQRGTRRSHSVTTLASACVIAGGFCRKLDTSSICPSPGRPQSAVPDMKAAPALGHRLALAAERWLPSWSTMVLLVTLGLAVVVSLGGCVASGPAPSTAPASMDDVRFLDRLTWGATPGELARLRALGKARYLETQLEPDPGAPLPPAVEARIAALSIEATSFEDRVFALEAQRRRLRSLPDEAERTAAREAMQQALNGYARDAAARFVLRALYSPRQLQEQLTWFWTNHFSVFAGKDGVRAFVDDYEARAIRPHVLGRFRDLLGASLKHPAMLVYLDNARNTAGHVNENYARELMELHTLGVDGGYAQADVQALARILTGAGLARAPEPPALPPRWQAAYVREGLFEFDPRRHDWSEKRFLGHRIEGRGLPEIEQALDLLARHPATAHAVSLKLARAFVADEPPRALVDRMAQTFIARDGDLAAVLRTLFTSPEFAASAGRQFKDPIHYLLAAARLAADGRGVEDTRPLLAWLQRMGEPLYGHPTPDGYPLAEAAWTSPAQMTARFDVAKALAGSRDRLFPPEDGAAGARLPLLPGVEDRMGEGTRRALALARTATEWNALYLAAPETMRR